MVYVVLGEKKRWWYGYVMVGVNGWSGWKRMEKWSGWWWGLGDLDEVDLGERLSGHGCSWEREGWQLLRLLLQEL